MSSESRLSGHPHKIQDVSIKTYLGENTLAMYTHFLPKLHDIFLVDLGSFNFQSFHYNYSQYFSLNLVFTTSKHRAHTAEDYVVLRIHKSFCVGHKYFQKQSMKL